MAETCNLAIHRTESGYVFRIAGRGTHQESASLKDFVCGAVEGGANVVLDLSPCDYLDSTFLGLLLILHQLGESSEGSFAVLADEDARRKLLCTAGLDQLLPFAEEPPECIGKPVTLELSKPDEREFGKHVLEMHRLLAELGGPAADAFREVADQLQKDLDERS
jgi:anti-anti-sigma factor